MTVVAFCSGKGAPGVSTLACVVGAVWPRGRQIVVAECDPSGNDLVARFGLSPRIGMTSLVLARRRSDEPQALSSHVQLLPGGLEVLVGPVGPDAAGSLDRELFSVGPAFPEGIDVLVDCGRTLPEARGQQGVLRAADQIVVVTRPDAAGLAHAAWTLDFVRGLEGSGENSFVVVGPNGYAVREMEESLRARHLGTVALDHQSAAVACGAPGRRNRFARSNLVASARRLADHLTPPPDDEGDDNPRTGPKDLDIALPGLEGSTANGHRFDLGPIEEGVDGG
jgi:MinD-like ATPase involved in chromosome partitioning or flagellar assembly